MFENLMRGPVWIAITCYILMMNALCPLKIENPRHWSVKMLFGVASWVAVCTGAYVFVDPTNASTALEQPMCLLVSWCYGVLILKMRPGVSAYCTVWSCLISECAGMIFQRILRLVELTPTLADKLAEMTVLLVLACGLSAVLRLLARRRLFHDGGYLMNWRKVLFALVILGLFLVLANYQFIFWLLGNDGSKSQNMVMMFRVIVGICGAVIMYLQNDIEKRQQAQQELEILNQMWHRQQEQYRLSKENIEIINRKCHDLKHQMAALRTIQDKAEIDRQVAEMEQAVMIYDSVIRTGNPVLDVVLTEKSLFCDTHQINMTCLVDGKMLDFIETVDLYTLFGNALDNAIESVMQQKDKQKRVIQVAAYEEQGMLLIRIRNYCENVPQIVDGLPVTSKDNTDYHGFGLKSIRHTAEKYGGGMAIKTGSNFFSLQILIPMNK